MAYPFRAMTKKRFKKLLCVTNDSGCKRNTLNHRFELSPQESRVPFRNKPLHPGKELSLFPYR